MNNKLVFVDGEVFLSASSGGAVKPSIVVAAGLFLTAWEGLVQVWKGICVSRKIGGKDTELFCECLLVILNLLQPHLFNLPLFTAKLVLPAPGTSSLVN